MKKSLLFIALIISVLAISVVSCNKEKDEPTPTPTPPPPYSPVPGENGTIPTAVLPTELSDSVTAYFTVNQGNNPPIFNGQFVSRPHMLLHTTLENDTIMVYNDRYIAFISNDVYMDFYGKQRDDEYNAYYEEAYRKLYVIGTGEDFTCYYITEGYPNGMFAKQSTVFSGKWNESYGGMKDFQVAVILLETSGNPNLAPPGSFRVLGDGDGLAQDTIWMGNKRASFEAKARSDEDAFSMFRVK